MKKEVVIRAGNFPDTDFGEDTRLFEAMVSTGLRAVLLEESPIQLLDKRVKLRSHLRRYYLAGYNANLRSRRVYAKILVASSGLLAFAFVLFTRFPLPSIVLILLGLGFLINPFRIRFYVRHFELPKNPYTKAIVFSTIKALETISILAGFVGSTLRRLLTRPRTAFSSGETR